MSHRIGFCKGRKCHVDVKSGGGGGGGGAFLRRGISGSGEERRPNWVVGEGSDETAYQNISSAVQLRLKLHPGPRI